MSATVDEKHKKLPPSVKDAFLQFARNGRWGTCGGCPRDAHGHAYPEACLDTAMADHHLTLLKLVDMYVLYMKDLLSASPLG